VAVQAGAPAGCRSAFQPDGGVIRSLAQFLAVIGDEGLLPFKDRRTLICEFTFAAVVGNDDPPLTVVRRNFDDHFTCA
jgi:hypothetical protein